MGDMPLFLLLLSVLFCSVAPFLQMPLVPCPHYGANLGASGRTTARTLIGGAKFAWGRLPLHEGGRGVLGVQSRASASGERGSDDLDAFRAAGPPLRLPPGGASTFWDRERGTQTGSDGWTAPDARPQAVGSTEVLVLGASRPHSATVIWLHGCAGDPPRGWLRAVSKLNMPWCKFLLPVAASRRQAGQDVQVGKAGDGGGLLEPTTGWADDDLDTPAEPESLWRAVEMVHDLVDREAGLGVLPDRIVIGGFGQGAAVALLAALTYPEQLAGAACFAGYLPSSMLGRAGPRAPRAGGLDVSVAAAYLPVLMCHGSRDAVVPVTTGLATYKVLVSLGTRASFRSMQGVGHGVSGDMMGMLRLFLLSNVGPRWPGGSLGVAPSGGPEEVQQFVQGLSVSEILDFLHARNIDTSGCVRKSDLVALAGRVLAQPAPRRAGQGGAGEARFGWEGFLDYNVPMNPPPWVSGERVSGSSFGPADAAAGGAPWVPGEPGSGILDGGGDQEDRVVQGASLASRAFAEWRALYNGMNSVWQGDSMLVEADEALGVGDIARARSLFDSARTAYELDGAGDRILVRGGARVVVRGVLVARGLCCWLVCVFCDGGGGGGGYVLGLGFRVSGFGFRV
jgi:predicted esterase